MHSARSTSPDTRPLKARIAEAVRERIALGTIGLGERLSDKDLAEELEVSRTPVREALLQLASEGLVVMHPQRGTFVFSAGADEVRELCELRAVLEAGAARLLAARGGSEAAAELAALVREARAALAGRDWESCERLDTRFHETLVERAGNALLAESYRALSDRVRALRRHLPRTRERVAHGLREHAAIAAAIGKGDGEGAAALLARHVGNVGRLLAVRGAGRGAARPVRALPRERGLKG
jgi:DNA-binding GntR family transcriptional regulator